MKEKKKKLEASTCFLCPRKVGADPTGFVRFEDGRVACLHHRGILKEALARRLVIFARNTGDPKNGKYLTLDSARTDGNDRVSQALDSLGKLIDTAAATSRPGRRGGLSDTVSRNESTPQNATRKEGEGGRGMGEFGKTGSQSDGRSEGVESRRPDDPYRNLFRDLQPKRNDKSTRERRGKGRRRRTA
jgi:hypothetical protein